MLPWALQSLPTGEELQLSQKHMSWPTEPQLAVPIAEREMGSEKHSTAQTLSDQLSLQPYLQIFSQSKKQLAKWLGVNKRPWSSINFTLHADGHFVCATAAPLELLKVKQNTPKALSEAQLGVIWSKMTRNRTSQGTKLDNPCFKYFFYMPLPAVLLFLTETWPARKWAAKHLLSPDFWSDKYLIVPSTMILFCKKRWKLSLKTD